MPRKFSVLQTGILLFGIDTSGRHMQDGIFSSCRGRGNLRLLGLRSCWASILAISILIQLLRQAVTWILNEY